MRRGAVTNIDLTVLKHAFALLAGAELGRAPDWGGPDEPSQLLTRTELLAVLLDVIPRSQMHRLTPIAEDWRNQFSAADNITAQTLRSRTRLVLRAIEGAETESQNSDAAVPLLQQIFEMPGGTLDGKKSKPFSEAIRRRCIDVLNDWATKAQTEREWRTLPNVIPGEQCVPIEQAYVDLTALPRSRDGLPSVDQMRSERIRQPREESLIDVATMVSQTFRVCVVLGEPGSGKSTLFQWLVWATYKRKLRDFDVAVAIRLREYSETIRQQPEMSLLEFFFKRIGTRKQGDQAAVDCLRQAATKQGRFLLLLDGWDEVPSELRLRVSRAIQREGEGFVVVLTSRISGSPWEIYPVEAADYYEISGLSAGAIRDFVTKQLAVFERSELLSSILERVESGDELRGLTSNPFLLGLLVRVLCLDAQAQTALTRARLYEHITQWIVEQQRIHASECDPLTVEHLRALERLSHQLIFSHASPQYVFQRSALDKELHGAAAESVIQSRFIHRLDPVYDGWTFLHATFAEYFAAQDMATLDSAHLRAAWEYALCSQTRLVTLGFFAGLRPANCPLVRDLEEKWFNSPDRFNMVLLRLIRIACFGRWLDINPGFVAKIEDRLWTQITSGDDWLSASLLVSAFAELDPREILRRSARLPAGDSRIWEALCNCIPPEMIRGSELYERLPQSLRDVVAKRGHTPGTSVDYASLAAQLTDRTQSISEFLRILDEAACIPERPVAEALLEVLQETADRNLEVRIIMALSQIYDSLPSQQSLVILVGNNLWPSTLRGIASTVLSHNQKNDGKRLDPQGRDHLLRRLAALAPTDPRVDEDLLGALRGYPIREGGRMIAELAMLPSLGINARSVATLILQTASDQEAVQTVVTHVMQEPSLELRAKILELAVVRRKSLPREWLERQITEENHSWRRGTLTAAYVHATSEASGKERDAYQRFLADRINSALSIGHQDSDVISYELARAFNRLGRTSWVWERERIQKPAYRFLEQFVGQHVDATAGQVHLAASILRFATHSKEKELLHATLKELLRRMRHEKDRRSRLEMEAQAGDVARIVADVAVGRLLAFPIDCAPVRDVLAERSRELGWLVFEDRILDANGQELANVHRIESNHSEVNPEAVLTLVNDLSETKKNAILSRWLVVQVFKLLSPTADVKEIHQCIVQTAAGENEARAAEWMQELYPEGIPTIDLWRQYMYRAATALGRVPDGLAFVRELGIGQRGRRRK